jgi:D-inositol-3-phosphate glycosyltransferase
VVLHHLPGPGAGGLEGQVHDLCTGLLARGVQVTVACRPTLYLPAQQVPSRVHLHAVAGDLTPGELDNPFLGMWRTSRDLALAEDWAAYDVVHLQSHFGYHTALRLALSGPRPALVTTFHLTALGGMLRLHELGFPQEPDLAQTQAAAVMEATLGRLSEQSIAVSQQVKNDLVLGYGAAPERVTVIYNGIDTELFTPIPRVQARAQLGIDPAMRYVLYVGPFFGSRASMLFDSLTYLDPDVRVLAIWPSAESDHHADRVDERVIPVGYVPRERMPLYYAAADLLAYPQLYAGFGLTLLEASACGCMPVAFNLPPTTEVLPHSAWLVDQVTPQAFAAAINTALRDPETSRKAQAGIHAARAHRFSRGRMIDQTLTVYESALSRSAALRA